MTDAGVLGIPKATARWPLGHISETSMALEPGKYLVCGELLNTRHNSVHGWLGLIGLPANRYVVKAAWPPLLLARVPLLSGH